MKRKILILSLGADIFVSPGTEIAGGQAVFAKGLAKHLEKDYEVTVVTLFFANHRKNHLLENYQVVEIPITGDELDAFSIWEKFELIKKKPSLRWKNSI